MHNLKYLIIGGLLLSGCAQTPRDILSVQPKQAAPQKLLVQPEAAAQVEQPAPVAGVFLPSVELNSELLYEFLLSEFADQRGYKALAEESSADIAQKTHDPRLAKRAAQLALKSGDMNKAVEAFRFWQETDPSSVFATRMLSSLLLRGGKLDEARVEVAKVLKSDGAGVGLTFLQLYPLTAPYPDHVAMLKLMRELAAPYPAVAEAHWLVAKLAQIAGDEQLALLEVRIAHKQRPEWGGPVELEAQLLDKAAPEQSLALLKDYLSSYPRVDEIRLQYARSLLMQKQYELARDEFQYLANASPDDADLAFAVALISIQLKDFVSAESELKSALLKGGKGQDAVEYFLGQLNEAKEDEAEALLHYRGVHGGGYLYAAQLREIYLLNKQGGRDEALKLLAQMKPVTDVQRVQLVVINAQLLRDSKQFQAAYQVLQHGVAKLPNNPELLYEVAMLANQLGHFEASERYLRKLIRVKPDYAQAYNALGYGFLERNVHLDEAVLLVEKALRLAPDDYAIMDSVGWAYYRAGRLDASVAMLQHAYLGNRDPEIAAHLGEVLWARGDKDEARGVWQDSLKSNPDNASLRAVMKRLVP